MKKLLLFSAMLVFVSVTLAGCASTADSPSVKKSDSGICHEKGSLYYKNTKNFEAYSSIDDCLSSGGRLPKNKN